MRLPILGKSSIFVFPSLKEGMPLALLEALAAGCSVIASDISGISDIIQNYHNGILFPSKNYRKSCLSNFAAH
jgi:glycosyltransferase involved in cell wall biosynthesis